MIDLAPLSKRGLELGGPLILAGGYGGELEPALVERGHALVTPPTSLKPYIMARSEIRLSAFPGGLISAYAPNPGLAAIVQAHRRFWRRLRIPVLLSLSGRDWMNWGESARRGTRYEGISAFELELEEETDVRAVASVKERTELPVIIKLALDVAEDQAEAAVEAGADALTIGLGPRGALVTNGIFWEGRVGGPAVKPQVLRAVRLLAARFPQIPLIAAGGVQTPGDLQDMLMVGARAVEIDTAVWRDPSVLLRFDGS